ncbi:MAG: hypothetical protein R3F20_12555 [Planctomycetota bacterium]
MPKKKKRLLFDVMGGDGKGSRRSGGAPTTRRKAPSTIESDGEGEIRLSYSMAGTFAVVFLVVVALAYYFGHRQGTQADPVEAARRSVQTGSKGTPATTGGRYVIRAKQLPITRFTRDEALNELREDKNFLEGQGFKPVRVMEYTNEGNAEEGFLRLFVGEAATEDGLVALTETIRALRGPRGDEPYKYAYVRALAR